MFAGERWRKALLSFAFALGPAMKLMCETYELHFPLRLRSGRLPEKKLWELNCEVKFSLVRRCRKAIIRVTTKHAFGEISIWWRLLKRIYGYICSFNLTRRDFNFAYFHAEQTQRTGGQSCGIYKWTVKWESVSKWDYEEIMKKKPEFKLGRGLLCENCHWRPGGSL